MASLKKVSKYRRKLFFNFFFLFIAFAIAVAGLQYKREKEYRVEKLEGTLLTYINLTNQFISNKKLAVSDFYKIDSLNKIIPEKELRITVVDNKGLVSYDSFIKDLTLLENHLSRPEIQQSFKFGKGASVRYSSSTSKDYYYYAVKFKNYYVRAALPFNIKIENYLKADTYFLYVIFLIFIVVAVFIIYFSDKIGKTINKLQHFAAKAAAGKAIDVDERFPNNELGMIGDQIVQVYSRLRKTKDELSAEREKLFRHLQISHEGIAVFSKEKKQLLANNHFIQYLNSLSEDLAVAPDKIFKQKELKPINTFIDEQLKAGSKDITVSAPSSKVLTIQKNNKYFVIQAIVFNDLSFEISINDITKLEKEKTVKQQMTSNIAHELKTPVSSILGYLETLLNSNVDEEKAKFFLERSYWQSQRLSGLIQDISLLNKIEEASDLFGIETINVKELVNVAIDDLGFKIQEKDISVSIDLADTISVKGNKSVFYSVWRNLIENAVNYAGDGITIRIKNYLEDEKFLYFSFSDNGIGIDEKHLTRVFERFYRVDSGRSRSMGGTGLGLAIVKNGVLFHKGEISVKNLKTGGLEFIFSVCKDLDT